MRLDEFAEEIISNIAGRLGSGDLFALRLVNTSIEHATFHDFATKHFKSKGIHITTDSLQSMLEICKSEKFRPFIKNVYLHTEFFRFGIYECKRSFPDCTKQEIPVQALEAYKTYLIDQQQLIEDSQDMAIFVQIFKTLNSVNKIQLVDDADLRGVGIDHHGYEKPMRTATSCPLNKSLLKWPEYDSWLNYILEMLLAAILKSGVKVQELEIRPKYPTHGSRGQHFPGPTLKNAQAVHKTSIFSTIITLTLNLNSLEGSTNIEDSAFRAGAMFPSLQHLTLSAGPSVNSTRFVVSFFHGLKPQILKSATLVSCDIKPSDLIAALGFHQSTLEVIKLELILLEEPGWHKVLQFMQTCGQLKHIHIQEVEDLHGYIYFLTRLDDDAICRILVEQLKHADTRHGKQKQLNNETYHENFTLETFPRDCGEVILAPMEHYKRPLGLRGNFICLRNKTEIAHYLPLFAEQLWNDNSAPENYHDSYEGETDDEEVEDDDDDDEDEHDNA